MITIIRTRLNLLFLLIALGTLFCIAGCRHQSADFDPAFEVPTDFSAKGITPLPQKWWTVFEDQQLNELIEQALADNFSIRSAWDRLTQSEQLAAQAGADFLPDISYQGSATRNVVDNNSRNYNSKYSLGLVASYEFDLWGRVDSVQKAAIYDVQARQQDLNTAAITLSSAIAQTWFQLAEAKQQIILIENQLDSNEKVLTVITLQFKKSRVTAADVFRQRQLLESTNAQLIKAKEALTRLQYQLSILLGKAPAQYWNDTELKLVPLKDLPKITVPAQLMQKRPDVLSAFNAVKAADMRLATAITNKYPTISISGSIATESDQIKNLFDDWLANLAANIVGPLFDAGYREANVQRNKAIVSEKLNTYSQTVLQALQEVEDALAQENFQTLSLKSIQQQLSLSNSVYERTRENYLNGKQDYIRVLESLVSTQTLERSEITARRVLLEKRIDLCRSIAGSWQMDKPQQLSIKDNSLNNEEVN